MKHGEAETGHPVNSRVTMIRDKNMPMPKFMAPALWGAAVGALGATVLGFTLGGWVTGSKAEVDARNRASNAVVAALAPICVENYRTSPDAQDQLTALKDLDAWKHANFVEERGWAKMPGTDQVNSAMAGECAKLILNEKT